MSIDYVDRIQRPNLYTTPCIVDHAWLSFYRAMYFNAKRGLAIACRPSVRLSVRL